MAATDILTTAEAKAALNIPAATDDYNTELAQVITAASSFCDSVYGPIVKRDVTDTVDGGGRRVWLTQTPVSAITSVKEYAGGVETILSAEDLAASTANDFYFDAALGAVTRRSSWSDHSFGAQRVVVVYVAGRYADAAACEPWAKEACAEAVIHFWQARGSGNGVGVFGGDGERFGAVPFSSSVLRDRLRALYPEQALAPAVA